MNDDLDLSLKIALEMVLRGLMQVETLDGCVEEAAAESEVVLWRGRELLAKINQARSYLEAARDELESYLEAARDELEREIAGESEFEAAVASIRRALESERSTEPST